MAQIQGGTSPLLPFICKGSLQGAALRPTSTQGGGGGEAPSILSQIRCVALLFSCCFDMLNLFRISLWLSLDRGGTTLRKVEAHEALPDTKDMSADQKNGLVGVLAAAMAGRREAISDEDESDGDDDDWD